MLGTALLAVGYPTSVVVLARFVPVVRDRRAGWFLAHQAAVAAIVAGWMLKSKPGPAAVNGAWLLAAAAWWMRAGRGTKKT